MDAELILTTAGLNCSDKSIYMSARGRGEIHTIFKYKTLKF